MENETKPIRTAGRIGTYFIMHWIVAAVLLLLIGLGVFVVMKSQGTEQLFPAVFEDKNAYWLVLHRKSNREMLYRGIPGDKEQSTLVKEFIVKTGIPGERPTPLPSLVGREYWLLTKKESSADNPETAPYFLTLDVPVGEEEPFGPTPYTECVGAESAGSDGQCNWELPGAFGLHGINKDESRLSVANPGSSGCVRHSDEDITYLYNLLDPEKETIRYYIQDV